MDKQNRLKTGIDVETANSDRSWSALMSLSSAQLYALWQAEEISYETLYRLLRSK